MGRKKIIKVKEEAPSMSETPFMDAQKISDQIAHAKGRLETFLELRKTASDAKKWHEYNFWVSHFQKIISDLEKK